MIILGIDPAREWAVRRAYGIRQHGAGRKRITPDAEGPHLSRGRAGAATQLPGGDHPVAPRKPSISALPFWPLSHAASFAASAAFACRGSGQCFA